MSRHYKIDGFELPSVTTIISDCSDKSGALTQWAANMVVEWIRSHCRPSRITEDTWIATGENLDEARFNFREVSKTALDIGSETHAWIENYLKTGKQSKIENDKVMAASVAFLEWKDEVQLQTIYLEQTVRGDYWAGTLDFLGWIKLKEWKERKLYVIDFKTSKAIYADSMGPQIAAYRSSVDTISHTTDGSGILRLDKETGLPEFKDFSKRYESDLNIFNKMVALYFARHPRIAKKAGYKEVT